MLDFSSLLASFASAFNQTQRLVRLNLDHPAQLLPLSVKGSDAVNALYRYDVDVLSSDAAIELKTLAGQPVELTVLDQNGGEVVRAGVVTAAAAAGSDGGFARYTLTIEPPVALLRLRKTSRVFQDLAVPDIVRQIIDEHSGRNMVMAATQALDVAVSKTYPQRSYCLQYRESDWDFITRLLAEEGIAYRFAFEAGDVPKVTLQLFDDVYTLPVANHARVRFHRNDATEAEDALVEWGGARQLVPNQVSLTSFDYKPVTTHGVAEATRIEHGEAVDAAQAGLDDFDAQSLYYGSDAEELSRYAALRQDAHDRNAKLFNGAGNARGLMAGHWFMLADHPAHEWDAPEQREFVVTQLTWQARNNLPGEFKALGGLIEGALAGHSAAAQSAGQDDAPFTMQVQGQRRGVPLVPDYAPQHKPTSRGVQTATVVGPAGGEQADEVYTDELGRIRVQFHWQRQSEHAGFGANLDEKSSCWIRVAYPSAGAGWGHQFIPRVGQEVLVDFVEGDIDRPLVTGVVYNGSHPVPAFSGAGNLPANKTLSGIKTKEHHGGQYGELLFDDTQGEVRTKLSSEHGKTQLNQGYLAHPRTDGKADPRGDGFELRTDQHGAVRAAHGVLISSEAKQGASGNQLDRDEAQSGVDSAFALATSLAEVATNQLADTMETGDGDATITPDNGKGPKQAQGHLHHLQHALASWSAGSNIDQDGKTQSENQPGQQPIVVVSGSAGVIQTTPNSQLITAGSNLDLVANRDTNQTSARRWIHNVGQHISLFVQGVKDKVALKLIAAQGKVQMQAQAGDIAMNAALSVDQTAGGQIKVIAGEEILLTAGGAYIRIKGGNIEVHGPGKVSVKGSAHKISGPASMSAALPHLPKTENAPNWLDLDLNGYKGKPMKGVEYTLHLADGSLKKGKLDGNGYAEEKSIPPGSVRVQYHNDPATQDPERAPPDDLSGVTTSLIEEDKARYRQGGERGRV
ncbi:type VI secretion system Vgr family protein [Chitinibacteraceae bacterium HSL-7]